MKVLYLTTEFPWPATSGGMVRTASQLRTLAAVPDVREIAILSVSETPVAGDRLEGLAAAVPKARVLPPVFHPIHLFDHLLYLPRVLVLRALGIPYLAGKWDSPALRGVIASELSSADTDVVYLDHLGMARYLHALDAYRSKVRVVLEQHNVESDFFRKFAEAKSGWRGLIARAEWRAAERFESAAMKSVDAVVAISSNDADQFRKMAGVEAHVVPVVATISRSERPRPDGPRFCYVGNLRWRPNAEGLTWFCQQVWPAIRRRMPDATFEIAGIGLPSNAQGKPVVPDSWMVPGVETVGFLDDLEPLYARSVAVLAPVLGGSGVRIKLLESFSAGMPVVTTPDGAAGLPLSHDDQLLIASDPSSFAEQAERLARSEALRSRLTQSAFGFLAAEHSQEAAVAVMERALGLHKVSKHS
ncbi:MAG: glycosyltransferase family 4 protein [Burkholderiales bacterium]|nr:glycosyltransferase family 4 protein [Burkholderiales bacterium]